MKRGKTVVTRMHSSRMRTGCSLTICLSLLPGGAGGVGWGGPQRNQRKNQKKFKKKNFKKNWWGVMPPWTTPPGPHTPRPYIPQTTPPRLHPQTTPPRPHPPDHPSELTPLDHTPWNKYTPRTKYTPWD